MNAAAANPDVLILKDAFSDEEQDRSVSSNTKIINVYAPKNTPVIVYAGGINRLSGLSKRDPSKSEGNKRGE